MQNDIHYLDGVYAAAVTPLNADYTPDLEAIPGLLNFLAGRGCHGALILGTTGEGPSFSPEQRMAIYRAALLVRQAYPDFRLLAGTGTPSLAETIALTKRAFDLGYDGVVVLPPFYFRKASEDGLFEWFSQVLHQAVPHSGALLGYHIPPVTGVALPLDLLDRLKQAFPDRFAGIKDSSGDLAHARQLGERFGKDLLVFNGNDRLFGSALSLHASGCITAMANLLSPELRQVWEAFKVDGDSTLAQARLTLGREALDRFPPMPPMIKALLANLHSFPSWMVCPPLQPAAIEAIQEVTTTFDSLVPA